MKILKIGRNYSDILPSFRGNISDEVIDLFDFLTVENDQFDVLFHFCVRLPPPFFVKIFHIGFSRLKLCTV